MTIPDDSLGVPGPNKRVFAVLVDSVLFGLLTTFVVPQLSGILFSSLYLLVRDVAGRSVGKMVTGLTIVAAAGGTPGTKALIVRNVPLAIPLVAIVEYFIMRRSPEGARWGDRLAGTLVRDSKPGGDGMFLVYSIALVVAYAVLLNFTGRWPE